MRSNNRQLREFYAIGWTVSRRRSGDPPTARGLYSYLRDLKLVPANFDPSAFSWDPPSCRPGIAGRRDGSGPRR